MAEPAGPEEVFLLNGWFFGSPAPDEGSTDERGHGVAEPPRLAGERREYKKNN